MKPIQEKITIDNNKVQIVNFINDIIVNPKQTLHKWSEITRQTPSFKLGYIGQHLASLITGVQGSGSGARGDDLCDGTEVKSCNKIDQLDKCKECGGRVLRYENKCSYCGSDKIDRRNDSKWLFSVRTKEELEQYKTLDRLFLLITDYPYFANNNFKDVRITAFEIYPKEKQCNVFNKLITNHYENIYLPKIRKKSKANPMNLHPYSYQFYKCNPTLVFNCIITDIDDTSKTKIAITHYTDPSDERKGSVLMPSYLLKDTEWDALDFNKLKKKCNLQITQAQFNRLPKNDKCGLVGFLDEELREDLPLRDIISVEQHTQYHR